MDWTTAGDLLWTLDEMDGVQVGRMVALVNQDELALAQPFASRVIIILPGEQQPIRILGRRGDGPGEFRSIGAIGTVGVRLWVWDPLLRRLSIWDPDGGAFLGTIDIPLAVNGSWHLIDVWAGPDTAGQPLVQLDSGSVSAFAELTERGTFRRFVTRIPQGPAVRMLAVDGFAVTGDPFRANPQFAVSPGGVVIAVAETDFRGTSAGSIRIRTYRRDGVRLGIYSAKPPLYGLGSAAMDSVVGLYQRRLPPGLVHRLRTEAFLPPFAPPIVRVEVSDDGAVWVQVRDSPTGPPLFLFVSPSQGRQVWGTIPCGARLLRAYPDRALLALSEGHYGMILPSLSGIAVARQCDLP